MANGPQRCDERDRGPAERVADEHDVVGVAERVVDHLGVAREPGRRVRRGQVDGDGAMPACLELRHEPVPAPRTVPGAVHEPEGRHRRG